MSARPPGERAQRWSTAPCPAGARPCARRNGRLAAVGPRRGPGEQRVDPSDHGVAVHPGRPPRISPGLSAHRLFV